MAENEEVGVRLTVDGQEVWSSKFDKATASVKRLGDEARKQQLHVNRMAKEMDQSSKAAQNFGRDVRNAFGDARGSVSSFLAPFQSSLSTVYSLSSRAATGVGYLTAGFTAAAGAATYFGLKTYASLEQANVSFTTLLGSQEKSTAFMKELQDYAAKTPFNLKNLIPNVQSLLAQGDTTDQSFADLTAVGDVASATATGQEGIDAMVRAIGQIRGSTKLNAQDMMQLVQVPGLNPYKLLADAKGVSVAKFRDDMAAGLVPGGNATAQALLNAMENDPKFKSQMSAQQGTLGQQVSNLQDRLTVRLAQNSAPLADLLKRNLPTITNGLVRVADLYGVGLKHSIDFGEKLWSSYKAGGMDAMMNRADTMLGTGTSLSTMWKHISEDSESAGHVFKDSLLPAIRDVQQALGPFAGITLKTLEGTLRWMDNHPEAAKKVFEEMLVVFTVYKLAALVIGVGTAFSGLIIRLAETKVAYDTLAGSATRAGTAMTGADLAGAGGTAAGAGGLASKGTGLLSKVGKGLGLAGLAYGGLEAGKALNGWMQGDHPWLDTITGSSSEADADRERQLYLNNLPHQANGGRTISSGWSVVGEKGPELRWMQPGATVLPLDGGGASKPFGSVHVENLTIQANTDDPERMADMFMETIKDRMARQ